MKINVILIQSIQFDTKTTGNIKSNIDTNTKSKSKTKSKTTTNTETDPESQTRINFRPEGSKGERDVLPRAVCLWPD